MLLLLDPLIHMKFVFHIWFIEVQGFHIQWVSMLFHGECVQLFSHPLFSLFSVFAMTVPILCHFQTWKVSPYFDKNRMGGKYKNIEENWHPGISMHLNIRLIWGFASGACDHWPEKNCPIRPVNISSSPIFQKDNNCRRQDKEGGGDWRWRPLIRSGALLSVRNQQKAKPAFLPFTPWKDSEEEWAWVTSDGKIMNESSGLSLILNCAIDRNISSCLWRFCRNRIFLPCAQARKIIDTFA